MRQDFVYAIHVPWNAFLLSSIWHIETQLNTTVSEKATLTFDSQAQAQIITLWASGLTFAVGPVVPFRTPPLRGREPLHGKPWVFSIMCPSVWHRAGSQVDVG